MHAFSREVGRRALHGGQVHCWSASLMINVVFSLPRPDRNSGHMHVQM